MNSIAIYPLEEFISPATTPIEIADGVSIISNDMGLDNIRTINISQEDSLRIGDCQLCLQIDTSVIPPKEASILFILSCRLLKPTKVFIRFRINYKPDGSINVVKVRDDYPTSNSDATCSIAEDEFREIALLFSGLNRFRIINNRSGNAAYFLSMAYRSRKWLESLLFHVCSLETLTSAVEQENGVTQKFTKRINNFIQYDQNKLEEIYNVRSELIHGRYNHIDEKTNLRLHGIAEKVNRQVFRKILLDSNHIDAFMKDELRIKLFE